MAAQIMESGDTASKVFSPRGSFNILVQAVTGTIEGDWFLYYTDDEDADAADWNKAHENAFSESNYDDIIDTGEGLFFQLRGGTGTNIKATFAHLVSLPEGKIDDAAVVLQGAP